MSIYVFGRHWYEITLKIVLIKDGSIIIYELCNWFCNCFNKDPIEDWVLTKFMRNHICILYKYTNLDRVNLLAQMIKLSSNIVNLNSSSKHVQWGMNWVLDRTFAYQIYKSKCVFCRWQRKSYPLLDVWLQSIYLKQMVYTLCTITDSNLYIKIKFIIQSLIPPVSYESCIWKSKQSNIYMWVIYKHRK